MPGLNPTCWETQDADLGISHATPSTSLHCTTITETRSPKTMTHRPNLACCLFEEMKCCWHVIMSICLPAAVGCLHVATAWLSSFHRDSVAPKARNVYYLALYRNSSLTPDLHQGYSLARAALNRVPQIGWLKITEIYCFTAGGYKLTITVSQGGLLQRARRRENLVQLLDSVLPGSSRPFPSVCCLYVQIFTFGESCWIWAHPNGLILP